MLSLVAAGCSAPDFDPDACAGFTHTQEFGLGWEGLNHRISLWDVRPTEGCISEALEVGSIGGDFSTGATLTDTPRVRYVHRDIWSSPQRMGARPVTLEGMVGPSGRFEATETFTTDELDLEGYERFTAVIRGLRYTTDTDYTEDVPESVDYDQRYGWTMSGLGAGVEVEPSGDEVAVTWWLDFGYGAAPDRPRHNEALPYAQVAGALDIVVIGVNDAPIHEGSTEYGFFEERQAPGMEREIPHAPDEDQLTEVQGEPLPGPGFVGLRSFRHDFRIDGTCSTDSDCHDGVTCDGGTCALTPGEYVREISVGVSLDSYDPTTGDATVRYDGYGSTATPIIWFHDLDFHTVGEWVWVQEGVPSEPSAIDQTFETGRSRWELRR